MSAHLNRAKPCTVLWGHLYVDQNGWLNTCCVGHVFLVAHDKNNKKHHISNPLAIREAWHSDFFVEKRRALLNGEFPDHCIGGCRWQEDSGRKSFRQMANKDFFEFEKHFSDYGKIDLYPEPRFTQMDLRTGNDCNLACRMCRPKWTKNLIKDHEHLNLSTDDVSPETWIDDPRCWDNIYNYASHVRHFNFAGGEPFLVKALPDFLNRFIQDERAADITLTFHTNLTYWPETLISLLKKFKLTSIHISLDAVGDLNEYIRYPSKWANVDKRIRHLDETFHDVGLHESFVWTTLSIYNVFHVADMVRYCSSFKNINPYPKFGLVGDKPFLNIQSLTPELKKLAEQRLREALQLLQHLEVQNLDLHRKAIQDLEGVIEYLWLNDFSNTRAEFRKFNSYFDQKRGQNVLELVPELAPQLDVTDGPY